MAHHLFTSESVTEGHPDKICDQISDAILDAILAQDPNGRVACECTVTTGVVNVMGEITTDCYVDIPKVVRQTVREIGYDRAKYGFDCETCAVITNIDEQSADIALGVDQSLESKETGDSALDNGAGDQGMMFGFACDETPELMPLPVSLAHKLAKRLTAVRKQGLVDYLRPDGKTQVTVEYDEQNRPVRVHTVVLSTQHAPEVDMEQLRKDMIELVIRPTIPAELLDDDTRYLINPTGRFVVGGPQADSGLTGRKIIVDTYGGSAPHGGGAFSGKDPTKVDRSAAYAARYVAKNIVAAGLARRCLVQLAYAIGVAEPVSVLVDTQGTGTVPDAQIAAAVQQVFDLRPTAIIRDLDLRRPIYRQLAAYGHMGREELGVRWEDTDRTDALRASAASAAEVFSYSFVNRRGGSLWSICSIVRVPPGGVFVICEEVGVRALGRRERIVIERCAGHRAVIPALGLEIGRDLRRLEDAAVARKNLVAGKAALLPGEVRHVRLREPARGAVRQDVAAGGRRRRGARRRGRGGRRCRRGGRLYRRRHGRGRGHDRVFWLGLDVERNEQHDQCHAERGKDGDEQRLAARRVPVLRRGLIRRIVLPAGHGRVVCPGIVLRLGGGAVLPAGREMLPVSIIRRRGCILLILRREDFIL